MDAIKIKGKIDSKGLLKIKVPTSLKEGDVEVIMVIETKSPAKNYDFSNIAGKLQWNGDPLKTQKELRNEW